MAMAMQANDSSDRALIDLRGVFKSYETGAGDVPVLKDINLKVREGEFVNRAQAVNSLTGGLMSEEATATVRLVPDPTFDSDVESVGVQIGGASMDANLDIQRTAEWVAEKLTSIGIETQRSLEWNAGTESFVNDPQANRLLGRPMRAPWKLG